MTDDKVINETVQADAAPRRHGRLRWLESGVDIVFGLIYAYYVWDAIRSLVELPGYYDSIGLPQAAVPWWLLVGGLLVPLLVYVAAFLLGHRRGILRKALFFFVGLTVVATLSLSLIGLESVIRPATGIG